MAKKARFKKRRTTSIRDDLQLHLNEEQAMYLRMKHDIARRIPDVEKRIEYIKNLLALWENE
jgi:hypothetical protein